MLISDWSSECALPIYFQILEARYRADGISGVDGREVEVAGERGLHGDVGGLAVADFADHHDVGSLAQNRAQPRREVEPDLGMHLRLPHTIDGIFDLILDGQDVALAVVELLERRVERRRLARSGRAGDEDDAIGFGERLAHYAEIGRASCRERVCQYV